MLQWVPSVSAMQDESYEYLPVSSRHADASLRIQQLEQVLRDVASVGQALAEPLLSRIRAVLNEQ
jgi:hypothetical protein